MQVLLLKMDNEEDEKGYKKVRFTHFLTYFLARMERKLEQHCKIKFKLVVDKGTRVRVNKLMGVSHFLTFPPFQPFTLKGREPSCHPFTFSPFHP